MPYMKKTTFIFLISIFFSFVLSLNALSSEREKAVLLPIVGPLTAKEKEDLAHTLVSVLDGSYKVIYGADVDSYVKKVFREERKKTDCDETTCYRKIAARYGAEKIVAFRVVKKRGNDYLITFNIYDVTTEEIEESKKLDCLDCSYETIKRLSAKLAGHDKK